MVEGIKLVGGLVGSLCGSKIACTVLNTLKPENLKTVEKIAWAVGGVLIGSAVGSACAKEFDSIVDSFVEAKEVFNNMANKVAK